MEFNDIYDENRQRTGRIHQRGTRWNPGEFGLVVCVWVYDGRGHLLLTRRAEGKSFAGTWENSGGAAQAGAMLPSPTIRYFIIGLPFSSVLSQSLWHTDDGRRNVISFCMMFINAKYGQRHGRHPYSLFCQSPFLVFPIGKPWEGGGRLMNFSVFSLF